MGYKIITKRLPISQDKIAVFKPRFHWSKIGTATRCLSRIPVSKYQNVDEACRGYDVPMGNPMPAQGRTDPGIRNQIFTSTYQNDDGYYALNVDFITANVMIKGRVQLTLI